MSWNINFGGWGGHEEKATRKIKEPKEQKRKELKRSKKPKNTSARRAISGQCKGYTLAGHRCKNLTKNANKLCHLHKINQ